MFDKGLIDLTAPVVQWQDMRFSPSRPGFDSLSEHQKNIMNTKTIGEISEMMVVARLAQKGFTVSRPVGDNQRYDAIDSN